MDDLDVFVGLGIRGAGKSNPMRPDHGSVNDPIGFDYDSIFRSTEKNSYESNSFNKKSTTNNNSGGVDDLPVYDKPVYDDDIFEGLPGLKSNKSNVASLKETKFENDVFAYGSGKSGSEFDDLLGTIGKNDKTINGKSATTAGGFDDLLPGIGSGSFAGNVSRPTSESWWGSVPTSGSKHRPILDDPFVVLESNSTSGLASGITDPLAKISKHSKSESARVEASSGSASAFDDLDPLNSIGKSTNSFSSQRNNITSDGSPPRSATFQSTSTREPNGNSSRDSQSTMSENVPVDIFQEPPLFDIPNKFQKSFGQKAASPPHHETGIRVDTSPASGSANPFDDIWLTVSEIPLFTQLTSAPPPSRPPPPIPRQTSRSETSSYSSSSRRKSDAFSSPQNSVLQYQSPKFAKPDAKAPPVSQFDELEEFAMGRSQSSYDGSANVHSSMDGDGFSAAAASAAAMKDAMDKAEAKFRHAKELREREYAKAGKHKESVQLDKDDEARRERELRESQERLERESKQKEEEEREQRRLEREREIRVREIERDRARQAVERATREARERAAADALMRAERSAVEKVNAEARERAERVAVQRAQTEARERAAAEARERAEKAAAEARERAEKAAAETRERESERAAEAREKEMREKAAAAKGEAEARRRAERAVFERVAAEARERAAAEARERAAAAAKMNQQKNDDDLESFFSMGRASSAPRARTSATDPLFNTQFQNMGGSDAVKAPSSSRASSNMRKASSTVNFVDDLSSIFGAAAPSGEFQEVDGESDERRRARLERQQRTQERAAKALAEKNQRDLQAQRDQEERHRFSEALDTEIKRWAAGKEGNLRALLSTLQYVLWPECGWQPVSLTDLINGASVKKVYRKATLCIHPDKVQQKGATLQQKYIAEKVFDLLKEAWNKFNSEELF